MLWRLKALTLGHRLLFFPTPKSRGCPTRWPYRSAGVFTFLMEAPLLQSWAPRRGGRLARRLLPVDVVCLEEVSSQQDNSR